MTARFASDPILLLVMVASILLQLAMTVAPNPREGLPRERTRARRLGGQEG